MKVIIITHYYYLLLIVYILFFIILFYYYYFFFINPFQSRLSVFSGLSSLLTAAGHLKSESSRDANTSPFMLTQEAHTLADLKIKSLIFDIIV
jgi:hypothetical protein